MKQQNKIKIKITGMRGPFTDWNGKPTPINVLDKKDFPKIRKVYKIHRDAYDEMIHVVGVWEGGRVGTFRGVKRGKSGYGARIFGTKSIAQSERYAGYGPLIEEIVKFFKTGNVPIPPDETIEIFAFMSAADESKERGGAAVSIKETIEKAKKQNERRRR